MLNIFTITVKNKIKKQSFYKELFFANLKYDIIRNQKNIILGRRNSQF